MTDNETIIDLVDAPDDMKIMLKSINRRLNEIEEKQAEDWKVIKPLRFVVYAVVGGLGLAITGITGAYFMGIFTR